MALAFGPEALAIDAEAEVGRVTQMLRDYLRRNKRKGAVVAVSGGIDSSVVAALCVRALGPERVFGLHMPESESADETLGLSTGLTDALGIDSVHEDISPILEAAGCYRRRDDAIRRVVPDYGPDHKSKIVLPSVVDSDSLRLYSVVVQAPDGTQTMHRLTAEAYLEIVAATNFKQRTRKMLEYFHADRLNYVVAGTPNRLEYDQGFFVKLGDGSADVKPIAHLYKTQVYALAAHLGVPQEIQDRPSTTDTYSLPQSQEEFYFSLPYPRMDLCLYALNNGVPTEEVAEATGLSVEQVQRVYRDIEQKRRTTAYLHASPALVEEVREVGHP
ncbi:NH(3)-dependent NAD(+) synthetase [Nocardioides flavus (ex Wang et al. 2016)]|uniref:NH(3)-dependent NAD(+) synthetase n=1 Tax=Nocardioides flavus (ex Wang et al. 2016) TaxID=2058780 RepID=A0ABQ3HP21_9ACTN|nr:NAD(+) synthase [Nocardioides flavus (ex Wang et al. 2016)]GHE18182.1 NH(3)-dependent NAD(+) synthetase [Nocardioides flavus (ex Wang et al. 2016)]